MTDPHLAILAKMTCGYIAARRDNLIGRQRRKFSVARKVEIDQLGEEHNSINGLAIRSGIEFMNHESIERVKTFLRECLNT